MSDLRAQRGPGRRSRRAAVITAAVACLVVTGCSGVASVINGAASKQAPQSARSAASAGASGTGLKLGNAPAASGVASGPPADPFAGTPAEHWADGAAGIVLPAAAPVGPFTKAQVEYAYQTTRQLLIAANLNTQTLLGGAPTAFANLLNSAQRATFLNGLNTVGLDKQGYPLSTRLWVLSFPPGDAQLIGSVIKVHGSMYATAAKDSSGNYQLNVHLDYLFVYPVEPPHQPANWMRVLDEDQWPVDFGNWQGVTATFTPWWEGGGAVSGSLCGTRDGYQHPAYPVPVRIQPTTSPTGTPVDPYQMGKSLTGLCQSSTGT